LKAIHSEAAEPIYIPCQNILMQSAEVMYKFI